MVARAGLEPASPGYEPDKVATPLPRDLLSASCCARMLGPGIYTSPAVTGFTLPTLDLPSQSISTWVLLSPSFMP